MNDTKGIMENIVDFSGFNYLNQKWFFPAYFKKMRLKLIML